jgi:uncharacterized membrane protein (DUF373 family)
MTPPDHAPPATPLIALATRAFHRLETIAYIVLGLMLAVAILIGIGTAGQALFGAVAEFGKVEHLIVAIDRLLFVLMIVEILHTVRESFRSGSLVAEPFLVVGLIASIRRILSITLQSSQVTEGGKWTPEHQAYLQSTMTELVILGGLILVMVASICFLKYSRRRDQQSGG